MFFYFLKKISSIFCYICLIVWTRFWSKHEFLCVFWWEDSYSMHLVDCWYTPIGTILKCCCLYELCCWHIRMPSACYLCDALLTPCIEVLRFFSSIWNYVINYCACVCVCVELLPFIRISLNYVDYIQISRYCWFDGNS